MLKHLSEDEDGNETSGLIRISETINYLEKRLSEDFNEIIDMFRELKRGILEVIEK